MSITTKIIVVGMLAASVACSKSHHSDNPLAPSSGTGAAVTVNAVRIDGLVNLAVGETRQMTATMTRADGVQEDITHTGVWRSSAAGVRGSGFCRPFPG